MFRRKYQRERDETEHRISARGVAGVISGFGAIVSFIFLIGSISFTLGAIALFSSGVIVAIFLMVIGFVFTFICLIAFLSTLITTLVLRKKNRKNRL